MTNELQTSENRLDISKSPMWMKYTKQDIRQETGLHNACLAEFSALIPENIKSQRDYMSEMLICCRTKYEE
jgi:hypothetical protein